MLDIANLPSRIGHSFKPIKVLPLSFLETDQAKSHRRLSVFHNKGLKCAAEGCECEGKYVIVAVDNGGGKHIDVYTEDFKLMTVDHIHPRSKGGDDTLENKQPMCQKCNERKADKVAT